MLKGRLALHEVEYAVGVYLEMREEDKAMYSLLDLVENSSDKVQAKFWNLVDSKSN